MNDTPAFQVIGHSDRFVGGRPDTVYGWLDSVDCDFPCFVKRLDSRLAHYNSMLLAHERQLLRRLADLGAPAATLVDLGGDDLLVTRFSGLSLARLTDLRGLSSVSGEAVFDVKDELAVWYHLMRRIQPMAEAGVLAIDIYPNNVVVPLTRGLRGQPRLSEVILVDHAHTIEAGSGIRRPVWIQASMERIAPELRDALTRDQEKLREVFERHGAQLPGEQFQSEQEAVLTSRVWAEYDEQQEVQRLLDDGVLQAHPAMQFAIGTALRNLVERWPDRAAAERLGEVVRQLCAPEPGGRFPSLTAAAEALQTAAGMRLPLAAALDLSTVNPAELLPPLTPVPKSAAPVGTMHDRTFIVDGLGGQPVSANTDKPVRWGWISVGLAALLGGGLGAMITLPW